MQSNRIKRSRTVLLGLTLLTSSLQAAEGVRAPGTKAPGKSVEITVYRSPTCGCCGKWLEHMKKNGFAVKDIKTEDMAGIKKQFGVPEKLQSCHTAVVGTYVVEGHVPAADVRGLLEKRPDAAGLAVPGMPSGTPGMEMGGRKDPFEVVEFDKQGNTRTFHEYSSY